MTTSQQPPVEPQPDLPHLGVGAIRWCTEAGELQFSADRLQATIRCGTACGLDLPVSDGSIALISHRFDEVRCPVCLAVANREIVRPRVDGPC